MFLIVLYTRNFPITKTVNLKENIMRKIAVAISNDNIEVTPFETIDAIKEAGFQDVFIQWYNKDWSPSQQEQLEYVKQKNLNIIFAHLGYQGINSIWEEDAVGDELVVRYKNDLDICKKNDFNLVIMHLNAKSIAPPYGEIGLSRIREITSYAKNLGIKIAFENTKHKGYLEYVISNIPDENVGICFDSGHCHTHFDDDFNFELFKDRIFAIHLHDNDKSGDLHLLPYDGTINWNWVLENLKKANYDGPITLELCYRGDYLKMDLVDFYKKGYESAVDLARNYDELD